MPKSRGSFFAIDLWNAAATRSMASSQVAGRWEPFSRTSGWVKRAFIDPGISPLNACVRKIVTLLIWIRRTAAKPSNPLADIWIASGSPMNPRNWLEPPGQSRLEAALACESKSSSPFSWSGLKGCMRRSGLECRQLLPFAATRRRSPPRSPQPILRSLRKMQLLSQACAPGLLPPR